MSTKCVDGFQSSVYRPNILLFNQPKRWSALISENTFYFIVSNRNVGQCMYMDPWNRRYNICEVNNDKTRQKCWNCVTIDHLITIFMEEAYHVLAFSIKPCWAFVCCSVTTSYLDMDLSLPGLNPEIPHANLLK